MFNSIDELEASRQLALEQSDEDYDDVEDTTFAAQDLASARELLNKISWMLAFFADPDLCKSITKRDRATMIRVLDKITEFEAEVENHSEGLSSGL